MADPVNAPTEIVTVGNVLAVLAFIFALVMGAWLKIVSKRSFKANDDSVNELKDKVGKIAAAQIETEKEIIRLQKDSKTNGFDSLRVELLEKFLQRVDFIREIEQITTQIEAIYPKIDQVDRKLEYLRGRRSNEQK
jgi:cell division protein FtsB